MTEHDPGSAHPAAEKLHVAARVRDQELGYLDAEYAKALASGAWNPDELHARYIQTREAAAAWHSAALARAHYEYVAAAGVDAPAIAVSQVTAPYPAPGKKVLRSGQSQLHEWQTPVSHQPNSRGILAVVALAAVSSISSANTRPKISPVTEPISTTRTTESCDTAFATMEAKVDRMSAASATAYTDEQWNALDLGPLSPCKDFGDWLDGARDYPGAVGFTSAEAVSIELLAIRCDSTAAAPTRVCKDMENAGML